MIPLATKRAGGIAWEYLFHFDGGSPPWTSGLSQGTALQVLVARLVSASKNPAYLTAAQQALGIFQHAPAAGRARARRRPAPYTPSTPTRPSDRILNGFIQAVVGLYDYTSITRDPLGLKLFEAGDAEARAEVPHYDTGAWSLYDQFGESDLNYHELLTEFLQHLCERTRKGPPLHRRRPAAHDHAAGADDAAPRSRRQAAPRRRHARRGGRRRRGPQPRRSPAIRSTARPPSASGRPRDTPPAVSLLTRKLQAAPAPACRSRCRRSRPSRSRCGRARRSSDATARRSRAGKPKLLWVTPAAAAVQ